MIYNIAGDFKNLLNIETGNIIRSSNFGLNAVGRFQRGDFIIMEDGIYNSYTGEIDIRI